MERYQTFETSSWDENFSASHQSQAIDSLENGAFLYFPNLPFQLTANEQQFLAPHYVDPKTKNISFDTRNNTLRGMNASAIEAEQIKNLLSRFAKQSRQLIANLFPSYVAKLEQARASLRPVEITDRKTSPRKDDRRLHVDAFPANPNQGRRILRVFSNINPHGINRIWRLGEPFAQVAQRFLPQIKSPVIGSAKILQLFKITKSRRTEYDHIMLQLHDRMKGDENYQREANQIEFQFPPGATWVVQTDVVSHAATSGQHLLEQTFYLPVQAMRNSNRSPLKILEQLTGRVLV